MFLTDGIAKLLVICIWFLASFKISLKSDSSLLILPLMVTVSSFTLISWIFKVRSYKSLTNDGSLSTGARYRLNVRSLMVISWYLIVN